MSCRSAEDHGSESTEEEGLEKVLGKAWLAVPGLWAQCERGGACIHLEHEGGKKVIEVINVQQREARNEIQFRIFLCDKVDI